MTEAVVVLRGTQKGLQLFKDTSLVAIIPVVYRLVVNPQVE